MMNHNNNTTMKVISNSPVINTAEPSANSPYVAALINSRPMQQLSHSEKWSLLVDCIAVATFMGGWAQKADTDVKMMIAALMSDISGRFGIMTESEIKEAFIAGAKGSYGENKGGLSVVACIFWMGSYQQAAGRALAKKEIEKKQITLPRPSNLTMEERRKHINNAYSKYLANGSYYDYGNLTYGLLDKEGLIQFTNDEKHEFLASGRKIVYDRLQNADTSQKKRENERKIIELVNDDTEPVAEAKRLAVNAYFKLCKSAGIVEILFKTF